MHDVDASLARLAGLDLNLLVTLHALLETGSVTDAARRLGRTQSTTSHALNRLREALDDPLLVRTGRGLTPTPRARSLAEPVAAAVAALGRVFAPADTFDPATSTRRFDVGCPDLAAPLLPDLLAHLGRAAPAVTIRIAATGPGWADALAVDLDVAIGASLDGDGADLRRQTLGVVRFAVVARAAHPALAAPLDLAAWTRWPHVLVQTGNEAPNLVQRHLDGAGVRRAVGLVVPTFLAALHVVAATDLLFAAPRELVADLARPLGLAVADLPLPLPPIPVALHWHERAHRDPGHAWLREQIRATVTRNLADRAPPA